MGADELEAGRKIEPLEAAWEDSVARAALCVTMAARAAGLTLEVAP